MMEIMSTLLYEKIRSVLQNTPGLTQKGLAERMGLNPAAVNRMLYGRRNIMADEIPVIEEYIGMKLAIGASPSPVQLHRRGFADGGGQERMQEDDMYGQIPVYDGLGAEKKIIDWVPRHPAQFGINGAFALYAPDDDMAPRYFKGELIYLHPYRPAGVARDIAVENGEKKFLIRRVVKMDDTAVRVERYSPARTETLTMTKELRLYVVIGRG